MDMLQIINLQKRFGDKEVLKGLNLSVPEHSIFGFIGKNGAGKTTIMKMISGLAHQTKGEIKLFGNDGTKNILNRIGCLIPAGRADHQHVIVGKLPFSLQTDRKISA